MKLSEYIKVLQALQEEVGDLSVYRKDSRSHVPGAICPTTPPTIVELAAPGRREIYEKEYTGNTWGNQKPSGKKVVRIA